MLSRSILLLLHGLASMNSRLTFAARLVMHLERPMKIEIVVDPSKPLPLASRVAPAPTPAAAGKAQAPRSVQAWRVE